MKQLYQHAHHEITTQNKYQYLWSKHTMASFFNDFQFIFYERKFDIITLSKTWLKNEKHLLE